MVPVQMCALKHDVGYDAEYGQRDAFLDDLQLNEVEGPPVLDETQPVGGYLAAIFEKGNAPRKDDDAQQGPVVANARFL